MGIFRNIRARLRGDQRTWFGIAGHGLRLTPRCPAQIEHRPDGTLCIERDVDGGIVTIVPGSEPALRPPTLVETDGGRSTYCFEARGPMIVLDRDENLEATFGDVETGKELGGWQLLGFGFWITFPRGFAVVARDLDERHPFFEVHLAETTNSSSFIRFVRVARKDAEVALARPGAAHWTRVATTTEPRPSVDFIYDHAGESWRQRRYFLGVDDDFGLLALAQARDGRAPVLFAGADEIARSFVPVRPRDKERAHS